MPDLDLPMDLQRDVDRIADQLSGFNSSSETTVHGVLRTAPLGALMRGAYGGAHWRQRLWSQVVEEAWAQDRAGGARFNAALCLLEFLERALDLWIQGQETPFPESDERAVEWITRIVVSPDDRDWLIREWGGPEG